jgi:hypothetical protein
MIIVAKNIDRFDKAVVFILAHLYSKFPSRETFDSMAIGQTELIRQTGSHLIEDEAEDPTTKGGNLGFLHVLSPTIVWLSDEGYIRVASHRPPHRFEGVVLSEKGLSLLRKPSALDKSKAWIDVCREAFKNGAVDGIKEVSKGLLSGGVNMILSD